MERLDFDKLVQEVSELGTNAQATLMFRLTKVLGPGVLRSTVKYSFQQLDKINAQLPEGHPYKERYNLSKHLGNDRKDKAHNHSGEQ